MFNKITLSILCFFFLILLFAWTAPREDDWKEKISSSLFAKMEKNQEINFLVVLENNNNLIKLTKGLTKLEKGKFVYEQLRQNTLQSQVNIIQLLKTKNVTFQSFYIVNAIGIKGNKKLIEELAQQNEVKQILDNSSIKVAKPKQELIAEFRGPNSIEWGINMINADAVWDMGFRGQSVVVAGEDTGVEWFHPAIQSKYRGWNGTGADHNFNWHDAIHEIDLSHADSIILETNNPCGINSIVPCDDHNHGTHTVGTMVGEDDDNQIGVAPDAKWIACRNMERGYGKPTTYIECFEWFMAPTDLNNEYADPSLAPHVINNSWSCPEEEGCNEDNWDLMNTVVNNLKAAGIVVVVSAGNSGSQGCSSVSAPAAMFENSFTIGSSRSNDTLSNFSSRGPVLVDGSDRMKPNVVAPGSQVRSCVRDGEYATWSGTSMAGPHVAGLVALLISARPDLAGHVEEIETIIESTAVAKRSGENCGDILGTSVPNNSYGFGRVDALAAVNEALAFVLPAAENENHSINTYPNPFDDFIDLDLKALKGKTNLRLFNATGQLLLDLDWTLAVNRKKRLHLKNYPSGIYFYRIENGENVYCGKMVKE